MTVIQDAPILDQQRVRGPGLPEGLDPLDPDVLAWYNAIIAAGGTISNSQVNSVNAYWISQKVDGLDALGICDWPMVGDSIAASFNLVDPTKFRINWVDISESQFSAQGWQPGPRPVAVGNGSTTKIEYQVGNSPDFSDSLEIEFRATIQGTTGIMMGQLGLSEPFTGWQIINALGKINFYLISDNGGGDLIRVDTDNAYNDGNRHTVKVTYDGSSLASGVTIEIDGAAVATTTVTDNAAGSAVSSAPVGIFARGELGELGLVGRDTINDVKITYGGILVIDSPLDEGSGTTVDNRVQDQPDGTVLGAIWGSTVNSYGATGFNPSTDAVTDNFSYDFYSRTDNNDNGVDLGVRVSGSSRLQVEARQSSEFRTWMWGATQAVASSTDSRGHHIGSRLAGPVLTLYKNGNEVGQNTPDGTIPNDEVFLAALNLAGPTLFSTRQNAGTGFYQGVTEQQALNWFLNREFLQVRLGRALATDQDALNYFDALETAGETITAEIFAAVVAYIDLAKDATDGWWTGLTADYPMIGSSAAAQAINMKTPGTYDLTFNGTWVHSATGAKPDGVTAYADPGFLAVTVQREFFLEVYVREDTVGVSQIEIGSRQGGFFNASLSTKKTGDEVQVGAGTGNFYQVSNSDARGSYVASQLVGNARLLVIKNGGIILDQANVVDELSAASRIFIGANSSQNIPELFTDRELAGASIGKLLTEAQSKALSYGRMVMNEFLGRAVYSPEATTVFGLMPDTIQADTKAALASLVDSQVISGNWDNYDEFYLIAADTEANSLTGLKGLKTAVNNGAVFDPQRGWAFGPGSYLASGFVPSVDAVQLLNNAGVAGAYILENIIFSGTTQNPFGAFPNDAGNLWIQQNAVGAVAGYMLSTSAGAFPGGGITTDSLYHMRRGGPASDGLFVNGVRLGAVTAPGNTLTSLELWIGNANGSNFAFQGGVISAFFIGGSTDFDDVSIHTALKDYTSRLLKFPPFS